MFSKRRTNTYKSHPVIVTATLFLFFSGVYSQATVPRCDSGSGCFPPVTDLLADFTNFPARSVSASSVCGQNSTNGEQFRGLRRSDTSIYTCQSASSQPINMVDNESGLTQPTYWQSQNMIDVDGGQPTEQFVVFNFTDEFIIHEMQIKFMTPPNVNPPPTDAANARPSAFSIEKHDPGNGDWVPLRHFAASCAQSFPGIPVFAFSSSDVNTLYCEEFGPVDEFFIDDDNWVDYNPGFVYDTTDDAFKNNMAAIARYSASAVRLRILSPASSSPLSSYVAISDVILDAQCKCFGHANSCSGTNGATCGCQHNTAGKHCDECLPLYNDRAWIMGNTSSSGMCMECDCNGYATSCSYDQSKGHGVCSNCTDNTTGDKCDTCVSGLYVNPSRVNSSGNGTDSTSEPFCLACNCNEAGTQAAFLTACDANTGQCVCKERVMERDCSVCKDTFWGLSADKTLGCDVCSCNVEGSIGNINMCDKNTGACMCKENVQGDTCNACKPFTFNFDAANTDGCTPCDCDPGASLQRTCDLSSGQCSCYDNIGGRDCRTPAAGNFVPRLDAIVLEPEMAMTENIVLRSGHGAEGATVSGRGFVRLTSANEIQLSFTATISGLMDLILRFERTSSDTFVFAQGSLELTSAGYSCNGETINAMHNWPLIHSSVKDEQRGGAGAGKVCLNAGSSYSLQLTNSGSPLLIDSVVFVPDTSSVVPSLTGLIDSENITRCIQSSIDDVRPNRKSCQSVEYSLMAAFLKEAKSCSCATGGALANTACDPYSGDCNCLQGVLPPSCTECQVDHYQLSTTTGCIACGCHVNGSTTDYCDKQGVCSCLTNVLGDKCDSCIAEHYGLFTGTGCTLCQCNPVYSLNNNCTDFGICSCKPGIKGPLCEACDNGYYNLTTDGCTQCACDPNGSTDRACDINQGTCECLSNVEGDICSTCKSGYFGLGKYHPGGCIPCFCWGHSQNCSSDGGWFDAPISSSWLPSNPNVQAEKWKAEDADGNEVNVLFVTIGDRYAMRADPASLSSNDIFFTASNKFLGDRKSAYGRHLTIVMKSSTPPPTVAGWGDVVLQGQHSNNTLIFKYNETVNAFGDTEVTVKVPISESSFYVLENVQLITDMNNTNGTNTNTTAADIETMIENASMATYRQLMEVLSSLSLLKIRAYRASVQDSAMDILSVTLDNAVDGAVETGHSGVAVNNIEMCSCGVGYTGDSCQECAKDYTRAMPDTTDPSSVCVPCDCNGHGVTECNQLPGGCSADGVARACNPVSGICQCRHNTMGDHCELCMPGYYGDPKQGTPDDCKPCACPGLIIANETNVFASSCSLNSASVPVCNNCTLGHSGNNCELCVDGFYGTPENVTNAGGTCRPCECNGRADTCDTRTGMCLNCTNNTAGMNCEICDAGFFGDAMTSVCQACICDSLPGSTGQCDHVTGVCECLPNVIGNSCDTCEDGSFNLTAGQGCEPCNCYMNGSLTSVCNKETGQCPCRNLVQGRRCDECQDAYWNVNTVTGCDPCQCNSQGTALQNGTTLTTCDVNTGQCTCALPGIVGRTCNVCSTVSKNEFEYVSLFYSGVFPNCELCGECFDSWASRIEDIGVEMTEMKVTVAGIYNDFDNQTAAEVNNSLSDIEKLIDQASQSVSYFETIADQLQQLMTKFSQAISREASLANEVEMLSQTEKTISATLSTLATLTEVVELTNTTSASLNTLRERTDAIITEAQAMSRQGNASWSAIQSLAFVVASPEERERQLRQQAVRSMEVAALVNQTIQLTKSLYETSLNPGSNEKAKELEMASQSVSNTTSKLQEMASIISSVESDISAVNASLTTLVRDSNLARTSMLQAVTRLQGHVVNASSASRAASRLLKDANDFKAVTEKAEQTIIDSMTGILENIASLTQAQSDLVNSQTQSVEIQAVTIPSQGDMERVIEAIVSANISETDVENLNLLAQKALFTAEKAVADTEKALVQTRELNEEVQLMESEVTESRNLRNQVQTVLEEANNLSNSINAVLLQAKTHSDKVDTDVQNVTNSARVVKEMIENATVCFVQRQNDVNEAVRSSNEAQTRAQSTNNAQQVLLDILFNINNESDTAGVADTLSILNQANTAMTGVEGDLAALEQLAQIQELITELSDQDQEVKYLELEIDQLTTQLDNIVLSIEESAGNTACNE